MSVRQREERVEALALLRMTVLDVPTDIRVQMKSQVREFLSRVDKEN